MRYRNQFWTLMFWCFRGNYKYSMSLHSPDKMVRATRSDSDFSSFTEVEDSKSDENTSRTQFTFKSLIWIWGWLVDMNLEFPSDIGKCFSKIFFDCTIQWYGKITRHLGLLFRLFQQQINWQKVWITFRIAVGINNQLPIWFYVPMMYVKLGRLQLFTWLQPAYFVILLCTCFVCWRNVACKLENFIRSFIAFCHFTIPASCWVFFTVPVSICFDWLNHDPSQELKCLKVEHIVYFRQLNEIVDSSWITFKKQNLKWNF